MTLPSHDRSLPVNLPEGHRLKPDDLSFSSGERPEAERPTKVRWLIFTLACCTSWLLYLHRYTFNFIGPALEAEYGYSKTELGGLFGLFYITYGLAQVPSGLLCDLSGSRLFLVGSMVLWSLSLAGFGATGNLKVLSGLRLLFGGAQAGAYPALARVSRSWFPRRWRTTLQGMVATTSGRLGGALSPIVMATLLMGYGGLSWRWAIAVMAGAGIVFALILACLFRDNPADDPRTNAAERELIADGESATVPGEKPRMPWRQALRSFSLAMLSLQQALAAGADAIYVSLMGSFFLDHYGVRLGNAGLYASLPLVGGALGGMVGGILNDRACRRFGVRWGRPMVGFSGPLIAGALMLVVMYQELAIGAALGLMAVKFFVDWNQPTVWGAATDLGGRFTGTAFAVVNTAGTIGTVLCPPLFGRILDYNTTKEIVGGETISHVNYGPLLAVIAAIYVTSALTWLTVDCRKGLVAGEGCNSA